MGYSDVTPSYLLRPKLTVRGLKMYRADELTLGFHGEFVDFDYRPYAERTEAARAAYDRLREDMGKRGLINPVIAHKGHVLVGMRRVEIALYLGISVIPAYEIEEDVSKWDRHDIVRLENFKQAVYHDVDEFMG